MQTEDKQIFDLIKSSFNTSPTEKFEKSTKSFLLREAKKRQKKARNRKMLLVTAFCLSSISLAMWLVFFNGVDTVVNKTSQLSAAITDNDPSEITIMETGPTIYLYHTHSRESFLETVGTDNPNSAHHRTRNISIVGEQLLNELQKRDIKAVHEEKDYIGLLKERGLEYSDAYTVSRADVSKAVKKYPALKIIVDIHRGSQPRDVTTININGEGYSKVEFFVSKTSPSYQKTEKFANLLHSKLEERQKGISRGVFIKDSPNNSTYNQDVFPNSVSINIGGVGNTLEEEKRTVEILASVFEEVLEEME
ncbi:stage II sporulation protein P [Bacillus seohaeanensis]|uniref:Stage II sporulation protein P n=1 Tax=Bacillus seohaeanensis TaxID=284580 RepID=A0ABW5RTN2_9BACI